MYDSYSPPLEMKTVFWRHTCGMFFQRLPVWNNTLYKNAEKSKQNQHQTTSGNSTSTTIYFFYS